MNEEKFTGKAEIYSKNRPSYPKELIDYLYTESSFNKSSRIADIGSGTGIFSKLLLERGSEVFAIEPNTDMRVIAEAALSVYPNYTSVKGTDENTTLKNNSVDFITVAQAFHWFDENKFKLECRRILKIGGKVALVWNNRDIKNDFVLENNKINDEFCPDFQGRPGERLGEDPNSNNNFFKNNSCEYRVFKNPFIINEESFIGGNLSRSYAPKKDMDNYEPYIEKLKILFAKYAKDGIYIMPQITECYIGEV